MVKKKVHLLVYYLDRVEGLLFVRKAPYRSEVPLFVRKTAYLLRKWSLLFPIAYPIAVRNFDTTPRTWRSHCKGATTCMESSHRKGARTISSSLRAQTCCSSSHCQGAMNSCTSRSLRRLWRPRGGELGWVARIRSVSLDHKGRLPWTAETKVVRPSALRFTEVRPLCLPAAVSRVPPPYIVHRWDPWH